MRDQTIDIAKGVGISLVVLGHCLPYDGMAYHYIYLFHMPLFFLLAGMFARPCTVGECLRRRSWRLLVPYLFYWLYARAFTYIIGVALKHDFTFSNISFDILSGGVLWFLISLWTIHLLWAVGCQMGRWRWPLFAVLSGVGLWLANVKCQLPLYLSQSLLMLPFFVLGWLFANVRVAKDMTLYKYVESRRMGMVGAAALAVFLLPCDALDVSALCVPNVVQFFLTPLSGILLTLLVCRWCSTAAQKLRLDALGRNSLHVYGLHFPLVSLAWLVTIPVTMRCAALMGDTLTGEEVKLLVPMQLVIAIAVTFLSHRLGLMVAKLRIFK